jgi:lysophospholipase L1-like esterase
VNRAANIALAVLAVVVFGAAIYVIANNKAPARHGDTPGSAAAQQTPIGSRSATISNSASHHPHPTHSAAGGSTVTGIPGTSLVIAFLGDDWTTGLGATSKAKRFSTLVCDQLQAPERNFGVNGAGYAKAGTSGHDYRDQVSKIVAADPTVVVVSGGRNDYSDDAATTAAAAHALFAMLHEQLPHAVLVAIAPFWGDSDLPREMDTLSTAVKKAVTDAGGTYLDIPDPIHGHPSYMADAADPNDKGYAAIAAALEPQLRALLPH